MKTLKKIFFIPFAFVQIPIYILYVLFKIPVIVKYVKENELTEINVSEISPLLEKLFSDSKMLTPPVFLKIVICGLLWYLLYIYLV